MLKCTILNVKHDGGRVMLCAHLTIEGKEMLIGDDGRWMELNTG